MGHAERRENLLANGAFPTEAGELSFEVAHGRNGKIVVLISAAKTFVWFQVMEPAHEVCPAEIGGIPDEIVARQARTMREKIARSSLLSGDWVVHLKFGEIGAHGLIPIHFAFVFENGEGESGEGFADRADREKRRGGDGKFLLEVAIAEAFGVNDFAVLHN